jgi:putative adhesin
MRKIILLCVALAMLPFGARAEMPCAHSAVRNLDANLAGVTLVRVEARSHDLKLDGGGSGATLALRGTACASTQDGLDALTVQQRREGGTLVITLGADRGSVGGSWGNFYAYLKVNISMPGNIPVRLETGSGDAEVRHVAALDASTGSGDLNISDVPGTVRASSGSGDLVVERAGNVEVQGIGSGDARLYDIHGSVKVGSVGSGDLDIHDIGANVEVDSIGSGDITAHGIKGNFSVHSKGSGDIDYTGVGGKVDVPSRD